MSLQINGTFHCISVSFLCSFSMSEISALVLPVVSYWTFQAINGLSALTFLINPEEAHRSLLSAPTTERKESQDTEMSNSEALYKELGFGPVQRQFLYNALFGWNSALFSVTLYGFAIHPKRAVKDKSFFLLTGILSGMTALAHLKNWRHHRTDKVVSKVLGKQKDAPFMAAVLCSVLAGMSFGSFAILHGQNSQPQ
jgi:hypothetical protein